MATKLRTLLKREVFALAEGRSLGKPAELLIDPETDRVSLVVLVRGSVPELSVVAPARSVHSFGSDTLALQGLSSLRVAGQNEDLIALLVQGFHFRGRRVLSREGQRLGRVSDVLVDEQGNVTEYRIRKGVLGWLKPALRLAPGELRAPSGQVAVAEPARDEPSLSQAESLPAIEPSSDRRDA